MNRLPLFLFIILLLARPAQAAEPSSNAPGLQRDVEFAKPNNFSLTLDAFVPDGDGPFPTCILVHGGGFTRGDKQSYIKPLFEPLAKAGFVWFSINYRLAPGHRWPACAEDVDAAIRWVKAHATDYKVDPRRIALIGESAGGHLVSWAGVNSKDDTKVAAVVPFYAPTDLVRHVKSRNHELRGLADLTGKTKLDDALWKELEVMSPISHVRPGLPPFLLFHGDADTTVALEQSLAFQSRVKEQGNVCDLITIPGGVHGMGLWDKLNLNPDYSSQLIAWLRSVMR